ncbi:conserved hypothetical protein [Culex quinquefasciatus]|uniref:Uncharacterized protein n=1 Tax=Culex quinquefasciatus TaxID=7176 RepID=B0XL19_CULQU|nr:conserved hypothetical protein [Culex quinquefasciatus]|eukprot:XP_001870341.1 conserved hypothetical protein [Culex quinquefasciatus]
MDGDESMNGQGPQNGQLPPNGQVPLNGQLPPNGQFPPNGQLPPNGQFGQQPHGFRPGADPYMQWFSQQQQVYVSEMFCQQQEVLQQQQAANEQQQRAFMEQQEQLLRNVITRINVQAPPTFWTRLRTTSRSSECQCLLNIWHDAAMIEKQIAAVQALDLKPKFSRKQVKSGPAGDRVVQARPDGCVAHECTDCGLVGHKEGYCRSAEKVRKKYVSTKVVKVNTCSVDDRRKYGGCNSTPVQLKK